MVFLTEEKASQLSHTEAQKEALKYSNLCKANMHVISVLEEQLKQLTQALGAKHQMVLWTQAQLDAMKERVFGKSSERRVDGVTGLPLFDATEEQKKEKITYERKKRKKFGRTPQPELPRVEIPHELSEQEMKAQGLKKWEGQFEISELINIVPTRFVLEVHMRQKYLPENAIGAIANTQETPASTPPAIVTASGPLKLKEGSRYSIAFAVDVGISKYSRHLPLDRQVRIMKSQGLVVTSQVLYAQVDTVAWYLDTHVMPGIRAQISSSRVNLADETYWENLGKDAKKRFWFWVVRNDKAVLFGAYDSRTKKVAKEFLKDLKGVLLTDGFQAYKALASADLILGNDWSHVRRKFVTAEKTHPEEARFFISQIRVLFKIEEEIAGIDRAERLRIRQEASATVTQVIYQRMIELKDTLPQSPLGRAIQYTLKLWSGLTVFLSNPDVPLHTNGVEQTVRGPVVGRKNHYGSKTLESARVGTTWYSVIHSCEASGVDPGKYIEDTLERILTKRPVLMPWEWAEAKGKEKEPTSPPPARPSPVRLTNGGF